jgi:two-component system, OmpR family, sensor kinase
MTAEAGGKSPPVWQTPSRWPVRWRLAAVSASLTLLILVCFAAVVGRLVSDRMEDDFHEELRSSASKLAGGAEIEVAGVTGSALRLTNPDLENLVTAGDAAARIVDEAGTPYTSPAGQVLQTPGAPDLGPPQGGMTNAGGFEVLSLPVGTNRISAKPIFLQYARSGDSLEATTERMWLLLGGGVIVGTMLALLAGLTVAGRAMRPIKDLTRAAREIAATRDPSGRVPMPETDDEIAELAVTLDQMLRELDESRTETEQLAQAQREFVADASHELRTPLTSILANLELLQDRLALQGGNGEEAEMVDGALNSSRRMRRLVADLLLLARADAGRAGVRSECDLSQIVASALAEVRPVAPDHDLVASPADPLPIEGNADELHRLVVNLLENGVRHTPPGTRVEVDVRRDGDEAVLEVADNGPGLPPGMEEQVFARFVRARGPADRLADSGTGLGLAIVQAVATSHGGRVEAGKAPHGGARFVVRLPMASEVTRARASEPAQV